MTIKASPDEQALLLDLQASDTRAQQLNHRLKTLPEHAELAEVTKQGDAVRRTLAERAGALEDAEAELRRSESDVELVEARIKRDEDRLQQTQSAKDAQGLEHELVSLRKRRSDLEDIELELMERVDALRAERDAVATELAAVDARAAEVRAARDAETARLQSELQHAAANRATIASRVPAELLALYERQRERYGFGASLLQGGVTTASGVRLNESDMAQIRNAAPDDVLLCPDSNAVLVRTAESGL
ncbi:zinc ribbon domain-containing protein [Ruicaihuangia caeni]|uniref:CT398-like coiled coil hairpin domain-containing protein n=1 Tax=Ruicaihuangia caeni TaxID=3042517 RepID=A0AAW6T4G7_9MICO|nr:hypothetical protein [Klugiella sp. YN-L-19]MDI2097981.1 hypothetical protein [Klugiella sp. YN-L-19]